MKVTCNSCQQTITVDETKASGATFRVKCPGCSNLIIVNREQPVASNPAPPQTNSQTNNVEELVRREVSQAKKEIFESMATLFGADIRRPQAVSDKEVGDEYKRALICDPDQAITDQITTVLRGLGYEVESAKTGGDALKKLDQFTYQVITVSSNFPDPKDGAPKILGRINGLKSTQRRQTFVVSISSTVKNTDATTAFLHGANIIVNKDDLGRLESLILEGQRTFQQIYHHLQAIIDEKDKQI
jgi:predicted Zn finger-like uncharacterized protein